MFCWGLIFGMPLHQEPDGRVVSMVTRSSGKVHSPLPPSPNAPLQDRGVAASLGGARRSQPSETEEDTDHIAIPQPRFGVLKGGKTHDSRRRKPGVYPITVTIIVILIFI
jgi:hypothetical protein